VYASLERALADGSFDAVVNLTPTPVHADVTRLAIGHGLHVYSEKPLATSGDEGRELGRLAAAAGTVLLCAPATVVFPVWRMLRRVLDDGVIGAPLAMRARFDMPPLPWRRHETGATWFTAPGVGPLRDVGIYALHGMLDLFGAPSSVAAQMASVRGGTTDAERQSGPDAVSLLLGFASGRVATLETGFFVHASLAPWAEVYGERGTIALSMRDAVAPLRVCEVAGDLDHSGAPPPWREITRSEIVDTLRCDIAGADGWFDYMAGLEEFLDVVRTRRSSPLSAERACDALGVIDRAYAAVAAATS
jgi:predicted dehydrogenase